MRKQEKLDTQSLSGDLGHSPCVYTHLHTPIMFHRVDQLWRACTSNPWWQSIGSDGAPTDGRL